MGTVEQRVIAFSLLLMLLCAVQVESALVSVYRSGLIQRAKRSLLWRWNMLKPIGASCRQHGECGTNYCKRNTCMFHRNSS